MSAIFFRAMFFSLVYCLQGEKRHLFLPPQGKKVSSAAGEEISREYITLKRSLTISFFSFSLFPCMYYDDEGRKMKMYKCEKKKTSSLMTRRACMTWRGLFTSSPTT